MILTVTLKHLKGFKIAEIVINMQNQQDRKIELAYFVEFLWISMKLRVRES